MPQQDTKLKVGVVAPDFTLTDVHNKSYRLSDVVQAGPLLLIFFRGTWCSDCRSYLKKLEEYYPQFVAEGLQVLGVAHQRADIVAGYFQREPISYPYLLDTDLEVINHYGLLRSFGFDALIASRSGAQTTFPSFFLIDQQQVIRWMYVGNDRSDLPLLREIDAEAQRLGLVMKDR